MRFFAIAAVSFSLLTSVLGLTYHGADFSSLINLENSGLVYKDSSSGSGAKFETILHNHGVNLARIRVWTSTSYSQYSLDYALALAKRARAAGMDLLVDLHYSVPLGRLWMLGADPGKQGIPASWPKDLSGLNTQIWTYTRDLVTAFQNQGTPITFLQIGNEINSGILWPGYSPLSQLLHSAANGARTASSSVKIMVHLANGWDNNGVTSFYNQIFLQGQFATSDFDILGFSFYPFYSTAATLSSLKTSLQNIINKLGKDVMIVETDWPVSCSGVSLSESSIPVSVSGQNVLSGLPGGHGKGIVYWEPGWVGNANLGSGCSDNLLVDGSGATRSSISMFSNSM
ncbi:arabinogalactan endo-1,4-beta-galactosidase [Cyathus striatus]|nr:arabinogalactan endo-1,4-beta-galactosidase [Cyathus striatus]